MKRVFVLFLLVASAVIAIGIWQPFAMRKGEWIQKVARELGNDIPSKTETANFLPITEWVFEDRLPKQRGYLMFSNGWASLRWHTIHNEGKVGDVALLRTQKGEVYISDYHFCGGLLDYSDKPQPRDLAEFLKLFAPNQHWKRFLIEQTNSP